MRSIRAEDKKRKNTIVHIYICKTLCQSPGVGFADFCVNLQILFGFSFPFCPFFALFEKLAAQFKSQAIKEAQSVEEFASAGDR